MIEAIIAVFVINLLGFLIAFKKQTDHLTDITYSISFILIAAICFFQVKEIRLPHILLLTMIVIWAIRLGVYLGYRIQVWGKDHRFDAFREEWHRLVKFWILQFISICIVALPILFVMSKEGIQMSTLSWIGVAVFIAGLIIESVADIQKFKFKRDQKVKKDFIRSGLWAISRHPNYLGECLVWLGIFIFSIPFLIGLEWLSIISPIWMYVLLRHISGGNLLEASADSKYGDMPEYQEYKKKTGIFFPKMF